jgi:hypothetical protein
LKVVSLNVGLPREVEWEGHAVLTSIFKEPVERRLRVSRLQGCNACPLLLFSSLLLFRAAATRVAHVVSHQLTNPAK